MINYRNPTLFDLQCFGGSYGVNGRGKGFGCCGKQVNNLFSKDEEAICLMTNNWLL